MNNLGYRLPFAVMFLLGIFFCGQYFIPHNAVQRPMEIMRQWTQPLSAFILFVAAASLLYNHLRRIKRRERRWGYSAVTVLSAAAMIVAGMVDGVQEGSLFQTWFYYLLSPIEATMFSLLAFFVASAAFRAFRARTVGATLLLGSAFVVMLGLMPVAEDLFPPLADISAFLLKYPNTAAKRAILIGVALGAISVAIKTILGIDRTVLGRRR